MMKFSPLLYENMQRHPLGKLYNFSSYIIFTVLSFFLLLSNLENLSTNSHSSHWHHFSYGMLLIYFYLVRCFEKTVQSTELSIVLGIEKG